MVRQGDIIWLDFDPASGREQRGRRPGLVVSKGEFHRITKKVIVCPITRTDTSSYLFHVRLDDRTLTRGVILCDHVKSLDMYSRAYTPIECIPSDLLTEVINTIVSFMDKVDPPEVLDAATETPPAAS
jgi:mRNA interferase MazF